MILTPSLRALLHTLSFALWINTGCDCHNDVISAILLFYNYTE